mgnify:FL=1
MKKIKIGDEDYPKKFLQLKKPPKTIWVEGDTSLLEKPALAIVGSRKNTPYGEKIAKLFATQISKQGIVIVSGLALGIDTIAHTYSKSSLGNTVAIVGSGPNQIYPEENIELAKEIIDGGGCLLSEYEPDEKVNMRNFPKRNRLICALSEGVFVVEADYRSGSKLTGNLGLKYGKKVFCVPRNIGELRGWGTNLLIQEGAKLVLSPGDILEEYGIKYDKKEELEQIYEKKKKTEIKPEYKELYNLITEDPIEINELAKKSKLDISELNQKITMMEIEGYIESLPGNEYKRVE